MEKCREVFLLFCGLFFQVLDELTFCNLVPYRFSVDHFISQIPLHFPKSLTIWTNLPQHSRWDHSYFTSWTLICLTIYLFVASSSIRAVKLVTIEMIGELKGQSYKAKKGQVRIFHLWIWICLVILTTNTVRNDIYSMNTRSKIFVFKYFCPFCLLGSIYTNLLLSNGCTCN
jgi:hypothetical protein